MGVRKVDRIIKAIDDKLIEGDKKYLTLAQANQLLFEKNIISHDQKTNGYLKGLFEDRLIRHAFQTKVSPRQWRVPLSKAGKIRKEEYEKEKENKERENREQQTRIELERKIIEKPQRPFLISLTCVINFLLALLFVIWTFNSENIELELRFVFGFLAIFAIVIGLGLWEMKKWAAYFYIGNLIIGQVMLLAKSGISIPNIIIAIVMIGIVAPYIEDME